MKLKVINIFLFTVVILFITQHLYAQNLNRILAKSLLTKDTGIVVKPIDSLNEIVTKNKIRITTTIDTAKARMLNSVYLITAENKARVSSLEEIPVKYYKTINSKSALLKDRIYSKTDNTFKRLIKWENKIKGMLEKVSPQTAKQLFANTETFESYYNKLKSKEITDIPAFKSYSQYQNQVDNSLKYIQRNTDKLSASQEAYFTKASKSMESLNTQLNESDNAREFIRERKNLLINESVKFLGKQKFLKKINKEAYYYVEAIKNYKDIFSDESRLEEGVISLLNKIPEFKAFTKQSQFGNNNIASSISLGSLLPQQSYPIVNGINSRGALQQYFNQNLPIRNNADVAGYVKGMIPGLQSKLNDIRKQIADFGGMGNKNLPDFEPNKQKTKTFKQRLEYGFDVQFKKSKDNVPSSTDLGFTIKYKLSDKSKIGLGLSYKMGMGFGWDKLKFTSEALGSRFFIRYKLIRVFDMQGGFELNYNTRFYKVVELKNSSSWQQSALLGISKSYSISKKLKGNFQALYDFLHNNHTPQTQAFLFRFGYEF